MKVSVPMAGAGVRGDPYRPALILHGTMHLDPQSLVVVWTDESFAEEEVAAAARLWGPGGSVVTEAGLEPVKQNGGSLWSRIRTRLMKR